MSKSTKVQTLSITRTAVQRFATLDKTMGATIPAQSKALWQALGAIDGDGAWIADAPAARASVRRLAVALLAKRDGASQYVGHEGSNPPAATLSAMPEPEAAYWREVTRVADRLRRSREAAGFVPTKRTGRGAGKAGSNAASKSKGKAAPVAPVADPDALRSTVTAVLSGRATKGVSPRVAAAIREDATAILSAKMAPAPAAAPAPVVDAPAVRKALADMITSGAVGDAALAEVCARYAKAHAAAARAKVNA